jgi:hypothetical protein
MKRPNVKPVEQRVDRCKIQSNQCDASFIAVGSGFFMTDPPQDALWTTPGRQPMQAGLRRWIAKSSYNFSRAV